jgi:hypothetical protein
MLFHRLIRIWIAICFLWTMIIPPQNIYAKTVLGLPEPGTMLSLSMAYTPVLIKGLKINPSNPLALDFIVATGNSQLTAQDPRLKQESEKLIKYFFAALTLPEKDVWVNLSPYEKDRIVPKATGDTEMGRDMLAQDYILKQITASLIYPEKGLGKAFWNKVYSEASQRFGTTEVPVNTFNKVWIVADRASVFESRDTVLVVDSHLKVMLEEDYLALSKHHGLTSSQGNNGTHSLTSQVIREIVLPALEKEINQGRNFAPLRQIFNSLILAKWYKDTLKSALLNQVYSDKNKIVGVDLADKTAKEQIFRQYLMAYKKGVFNYIKEDTDQATQQPIPRKYFSGGVSAAMVVERATASQAMISLKKTAVGTLLLVRSLATSFSNKILGDDPVALAVSRITKLVKSNNFGFKEAGQGTVDALKKYGLTYTGGFWADNVDDYKDFDREQGVVTFIRANGDILSREELNKLGSSLRMHFIRDEQDNLYVVVVDAAMAPLPSPDFIISGIEYDLLDFKVQDHKLHLRNLEVRVGQNEGYRQLGNEALAELVTYVNDRYPQINFRQDKTPWDLAWEKGVDDYTDRKVMALALEWTKKAKTNAAMNSSTDAIFKYQSKDGSEYEARFIPAALSPQADLVSIHDMVTGKIYRVKDQLPRTVFTIGQNGKTVVTTKKGNRIIQQAEYSGYRIPDLRSNFERMTRLSEAVRPRVQNAAMAAELNEADLWAKVWTGNEWDQLQEKTSVVGEYSYPAAHVLAALRFFEKQITPPLSIILPKPKGRWFSKEPVVTHASMQAWNPEMVSDHPYYLYVLAQIAKDLAPKVGLKFTPEDTSTISAENPPQFTLVNEKTPDVNKAFESAAKHMMRLLNERQDELAVELGLKFTKEGAAAAAGHKVFTVPHTESKSDQAPKHNIHNAIRVQVPLKIPPPAAALPVEAVPEPAPAPESVYKVTELSSTPDIEIAEGEKGYLFEGPEGKKIFKFNAEKKTLQSFGLDGKPIAHDFRNSIKNGWGISPDGSTLLDVKAFEVKGDEVSFDGGKHQFSIGILLSPVSPIYDVKSIPLDARQAASLKQAGSAQSYLIGGKYVLIKDDDRLLAFSIDKDGQYQPISVFDPAQWESFGIGNDSGLKVSGGGSVLEGVSSFEINALYDQWTLNSPKTGNIVFGVKSVFSDKAMAKIAQDLSVAVPPGGIDLSAANMSMTVAKDANGGVRVNFDPAAIEQFRQGHFDGIVPVITGITAIANVYPLLGLKEPEVRIN